MVYPVSLQPPNVISRCPSLYVVTLPLQQTADREHGCALLPSESFHSVLSVVIDTHHQLVWIWNQHGDKCLHVLVRRLLGGANCGGKSHPKHWQHQSMVCAGLNKRRKPVAEQPSFFSLLADCGWYPVSSSHSCPHAVPTTMDCTLQWRPKQTFPPKLLMWRLLSHK